VGFWGLLFGSALFLVPGVGPIVEFGPLVGWIAGTPEGAVVVGGLSAVGAALYSVGIPRTVSCSNETALKTNKFLLLAHGTADEVPKAKSPLETTGAANIVLPSGCMAA
jgi:hypothetical protein